MKFTQRAAILISVGITGVIPIASINTATASAAPVSKATHARHPDTKIKHTIPVGHLPFAIATNPVTDTIYVTNLNDNTVSVINGRSRKVMATVFNPAFSPIGIATNPVTNTIYVAGNAAPTVAVINGQTNTVGPQSPWACSRPGSRWTRRPTRSTSRTVTTTRFL